jgi:hypothetical protein
MELRQNWHKFQRILGPLPPKKPGMVVLHSNNRILSAALSLHSSGQSNSGFADQGRTLDPIEGAWEVLSHKYNCSGATFLESEALMEAVAQVASVRPTAPATDHFHAQLVKLREMIGVEKGEKTKLAQHFGDRPFEQYWPRKNFLLSIFRSFFGELFPERKLLLLAVVSDSNQLESILLEFHGSELKGFCEPDFSGLDWKGLDLFLPETAARFVSWCESHYMLPAYTLFLTKRVWEDCRQTQMTSGERSAWKSLMKFRSARDVEKEVLFEPEPWPLKALLRWLALRA